MPALLPFKNTQSSSAHTFPYCRMFLVTVALVFKTCNSQPDQNESNADREDRLNYLVELRRSLDSAQNELHEMMAVSMAEIERMEKDGLPLDNVEYEEETEEMRILLNLAQMNLMQNAALKATINDLKGQPVTSSFFRVPIKMTVLLVFTAIGGVLIGFITTTAYDRYIASRLVHYSAL